jgi:thiol-disulfide isomerase/thioredoxin
LVGVAGATAAIVAVVLASRLSSEPTVVPDRDHPVLALGSAAPDFSLAGIDGRTYRLADFAAAKALAVVFQCNHCPVSQLYEARIQQLHADYASRGVAIVAINPESSAGLRDDDLAYSDVGETYEEMKLRAAHRGYGYPYLYDGETQTVASQFGVVATPHIFVFDADRRLRYQGRIDDDVSGRDVGRPYAREAIDAVLAGDAPPISDTALVGCAIRWLSKIDAGAEREAALAAARAEPVALAMADAAVLSRLRTNDTDSLLLVNFWATWCGPCITEFPDLVRTHRMYRGRGLELVTVSTNDPEAREDVLAFLREQRASSRNLLFATPDIYELQAAFDPEMPSAVPFTVLLAPDGGVLYQETGVLSMWAMRRAILANLPEDERYPGSREYWTQ